MKIQSFSEVALFTVFCCCREKVMIFCLIIVSTTQQCCVGHCIGCESANVSIMCQLMRWCCFVQLVGDVSVTCQLTRQSMYWLICCWDWICYHAPFIICILLSQASCDTYRYCMHPFTCNHGSTQFFFSYLIAMYRIDLQHSQA